MWFTETYWPPVVACGVAVFVLLILWQQNARRLYLGLALGCIALAFGFVALEGAIVTDREQVMRNIQAMIDAAEENDPEAIIEHFDEGLKAGHADFVRSNIARIEIRGQLRLIDNGLPELTAEGTRATVDFRVNGTVRAIGVDYHAPTRWTSTWRKVGDAWKLTRLVSLHPVNGEPSGLVDME